MRELRREPVQLGWILWSLLCAGSFIVARAHAGSIVSTNSSEPSALRFNEDVLLGLKVRSADGGLIRDEAVCDAFRSSRELEVCILAPQAAIPRICVEDVDLDIQYFVVPKPFFTTPRLRLLIRETVDGVACGAVMRQLPVTGNGSYVEEYVLLPSSTECNALAADREQQAALLLALCVMTASWALLLASQWISWKRYRQGRIEAEERSATEAWDAFYYHEIGRLEKKRRRRWMEHRIDILLKETTSTRPAPMIMESITDEIFYDDQPL